MSAAATVRLLNRTGEFALVNDAEETVATGRVLPSRTRPGYLTLRFDWPPAAASFRAPLRVPLDWLAALETAGREDNDD